MHFRSLLESKLVWGLCLVQLKTIFMNQTLIFAQRPWKIYEGSRCCNIFDIGRQGVVVEYKYNLSPITRSVESHTFLNRNIISLNANTTLLNANIIFANNLDLLDLFDFLEYRYDFENQILIMWKLCITPQRAFVRVSKTDTESTQFWGEQNCASFS